MTSRTEISEPARRIRRAYRAATARAGGTWRSLVTVAGSARPAVEERADEVVRAASVNKLAIACAVLDLVDRGALRLDRRLELKPELVVGGSGIYHSQPVFGDRLTVAGALTAMLLVSDNTAVRLCGLVCPGARVNQYLARHGFRHTRVEPVDARRMYLGTTTAREMHRLLSELVAGRLVGAASTRFVLDVMRSTSGFHDGVRRGLSSDERSRIAVKHGAYEDRRHEVGIVFDRADAPAVVFALLATLPGHDGDFGATHPLVQARARLGRALLAP